MDIEVSGSTSTPTFKWEYKDSDGNWVETNDVPTNAGNYRVTIVVPGDDNYEETSVGSIEFTIEKSTSTTVIVNETEITAGLSKEYDGEPINTDDLDIEVNGSSAAPTFEWEY